MRKLFQEVTYALIGMALIGATFIESTNSYAQAEEVVIPGYTPPAPTAPSPNVTPTGGSTAAIQTGSQPASRRNISTDPVYPPTPQGMHQSCERYIPITASIDTIRDNLKNKVDEKSSFVSYEWIRDGEPAPLIINFADENTPVSFTGNLPTNIPNAKDLHFSLSDVRQALAGMPGKMLGHTYEFSPKKGQGTMEINTDSDNNVTKFTTSFACS